MGLLRRIKICRVLSRFNVIIWCLGFLFTYVFILAFNLVDQPNEVRFVQDVQPEFTAVKSTNQKQMDSTKGVNISQKQDARASDAKSSLHGCPEWYEDTFDENLRVISEYPRGDVNNMVASIKGNRDSPAQMMTSFPVIATAANSGFYDVAQGLLKSIHELVLPKYPDLKIVFYDLGLSVNQREELKVYCKCEVRIFPFGDYPGHVKHLKKYAWKPIIVQTLLMEYGWVWWMDSSVRFITSDLDRALQYSKDNHMLFFTYGPTLSVAYQTDTQTMKYLKEDPCKFRPFGEIEATFVLFRHDDVTSVLVESWCACALTGECIAPPGTESKLGCNAGKKMDGRCHRFDQAILSILLRRLYHEQNDYPLVKEPFKIHTIKRGNRIAYFRSLKT